MPSDEVNVADVTLAVLAGGEARRMGYAKAEMRLSGRPILHVLLEQFAWPGPTLLITAPGRERPTGWERFTKEVFDPTPGQGPLRGLLTALENTPTHLVVATAVDMPFVRQDHLRTLALALQCRRGVAGLMLREGNEGQIQPFPSAFNVTAAPILKRALESGRRSLHGLLADPSVIAIDAPASWEPATWTNLNSPEDLDSVGR